jgi:GNAT superfamily N-acetyltransferase
MNAYPPGLIILRSATPADSGEVQRMFSSHLAELNLTPNPVLDEDINHFARHYAPPHSTLLLAVDGHGTMVGMAGLLRDEFRRVFVEPAFRRSGIATQLIQALVAQRACPGSSRFRAFIARDNHASQRLFLRLGFRAAITVVNPSCPPNCDFYELEIVTTQTRRPPAGLAA